MAVVEVFTVIVGLWLASSAIALIALVGLYLAERARSRGGRTAPRDEGATVTRPSEAGRP